MSEIAKRKPVNDRRKFILNMAKGIGLSAMGGLIWSAYVD